METSSSEVSLRVSVWGYLLPAVPQMVVAAAMGVLLVNEPRNVAGWVLLVVSCGGAVMRFVELRHAARIGWLVTISAAGVRWNDTGLAMAWHDVAEIRVSVTHGWRRLLPHLPDRIMLVTPAQAAFSYRAGSRPIGRSIYMRRIEDPPTTVVAALQRFTNAPTFAA